MLRNQKPDSDSYRNGNLSKDAMLASQLRSHEGKSGNQQSTNPKFYPERSRRAEISNPKSNPIAVSELPESKPEFLCSIPKIPVRLMTSKNTHQTG